MVEQERLNALKRAAWESHDLELFEFYIGIERELERLRVIGRIVAAFYQHVSGDDAWNDLFNALADAGLLDAYTEKDDG